MGKIFNKGLSEEDKKEELLKKLKNIEDKNEQQLQVVKDQGGKQLAQLKNIDKCKTLEITDKISKKMMKQINYCLNLKKIDKTLQNADLVCTKTDGTPYNFNPKVCFIIILIF